MVSKVYFKVGNYSLFPVTSLLCYASVFHRRQKIVNFMQHMDTFWDLSEPQYVSSTPSLSVTDLSFQVDFFSIIISKRSKSLRGSLLSWRQLQTKVLPILPSLLNGWKKSKSIYEYLKSRYRRHKKWNIIRSLSTSKPASMSCQHPLCLCHLWMIEKGEAGCSPWALAQSNSHDAKWAGLHTVEGNSTPTGYRDSRQAFTCCARLGEKTQGGWAMDMWAARMGCCSSDGRETPVPEMRWFSGRPDCVKHVWTD